MGGYYTPSDGDVLSATNWDTYVRDQTVNQFASAAARSSAIASPVAGMLTYRADGKLFEGYVNGGWVAIPTDMQLSYCTADMSVVSNVALQTPSGMSFTVAANAAYIAECTLFYAAGTVGDFAPSWSLPSGATIRTAPINVATGIATGGDTNATVQMHQATTADPGFSFGGANAAPGTVGKLYAYIKTSGTSGTVQFQFRQSVSDATATTLHEGSWVWVKRVA